MLETLFILPISFWAVILLLVGGGIAAYRHLDDATGIPLLAVLGTTAAWYVGDAFYNDYANNHAKIFTPETLSGAWWQVAWFILVILLTVRAAARKTQRCADAAEERRATAFQKMASGYPEIQKQLNILFTGCAAVWLILFVIALILLKAEIPYTCFHFWGYKANPWSHGRIGAGFGRVFHYRRLPAVADILDVRRGGGAGDQAAHPATGLSICFSCPGQPSSLTARATRCWRWRCPLC
jgi:hypothetical protein